LFVEIENNLFAVTIGCGAYQAWWCAIRSFDGYCLVTELNQAMVVFCLAIDAWLKTKNFCGKYFSFVTICFFASVEIKVNGMAKLL